MSDTRPTIVHRFFAAMQGGAAAENEMLPLFHENAVYIEPFSGARREHVGAAAIRKVMREGWKHPLPDMRIEVDEILIDADQIRARWSCYSPALPGGRGTGVNHFTLRDGKIIRLETFIESPGGERDA